MQVSYPNVGSIHFTHEHGAASADPLPGTGEVYHVHGFYVEHNHRNQGLGKKYHKERLDYFERDLCITTLTCVVRADNIAELKIMKRFSWEQLGAFRNTEGDALFLFSKDVR